MFYIWYVDMSAGSWLSDFIDQILSRLTYHPMQLIYHVCVHVSFIVVSCMLASYGNTELCRAGSIKGNTEWYPHSTMTGNVCSDFPFSDLNLTVCGLDISCKKGIMGGELNHRYNPVCKYLPWMSLAFFGELWIMYTCMQVVSLMCDRCLSLLPNSD